MKPKSTASDRARKGHLTRAYNTGRMNELEDVLSFIRGELNRTETVPLLIDGLDVITLETLLEKLSDGKHR